jgi:hypothetical protein
MLSTKREALMRSSSKTRVRYWHIAGRTSRPRLAHPGPTLVAFPRYESEPPSTGTRARSRRVAAKPNVPRPNATPSPMRRRSSLSGMRAKPVVEGCGSTRLSVRSSRRGFPGCHSPTRPAVSLARLICARSIGIPARRFRASFHQRHIAGVRRTHRTA